MFQLLLHAKARPPGFTNFAMSKHLEWETLDRLPIRFWYHSFSYMDFCSPSTTTFFLSAPLSEIVDPICSFPLLEVLILQGITTPGDADEHGTPSNSPRLTGSLHVLDLTPSVMRGSLDFPSGLHFAMTVALRPIECTEPVANLTPSCSDTSESLTIGFNSPSLVSFASVVSQYFTPAKRCGVQMYRTQRSMDYRHPSNRQTHKPPESHDHDHFP